MRTSALQHIQVPTSGKKKPVKGTERKRGKQKK